MKYIYQASLSQLKKRKLPPEQHFNGIIEVSLNTTEMNSMTDAEIPVKKTRTKKEPYKQADFIGIDLAIDDMVAFSMGEASNIALGRVVGFTEKCVRVEVIPLPNVRVTAGYSWRGDKPIIRKPSQIVKLPTNIQEFNYLPKEWIAQVFG